MNVTINNDTQLKMSSATKRKHGLVNTVMWFLVLAIVPQVNAMIILFFYYSLAQGSMASITNFGDWYSSISILSISALIGLLITFPLLLKATPAKSLRECFKYWAMFRIQSKELAIWGVLFAILFGVIQVAGWVLEVPTEPFIIDMKKEVTSSISIVILFLTAGGLAPIVEEIIYRGWLYQRLIDCNIGAKKVVILTSLVFALVHSQYEQGFTFITIFSFGLLFAYIRYKSQNITYSIIIHILYNSALLFYTLFFMA